jgi:hypothetical protein
MWIPRDTSVLFLRLQIQQYSSFKRRGVMRNEKWKHHAIRLSPFLLSELNIFFTKNHWNCFQCPHSLISPSAGSVQFPILCLYLKHILFYLILRFCSYSFHRFIIVRIKIFKVVIIFVLLLCLFLQSFNSVTTQKGLLLMWKKKNINFAVSLVF